MLSFCDEDQRSQSHTVRHRTIWIFGTLWTEQPLIVCLFINQRLFNACVLRMCLNEFVNKIEGEWLACSSKIIMSLAPFKWNKRQKTGSAWKALSFVETYPNLINCTFPRTGLQRVAKIKKQTKNINDEKRSSEIDVFRNLRLSNLEIELLHNGDLLYHLTVALQLLEVAAFPIRSMLVASLHYALPVDVEASQSLSTEFSQTN